MAMEQAHNLVQQPTGRDLLYGAVRKNDFELQQIGQTEKRSPLPVIRCGRRQYPALFSTLEPSFGWITHALNMS